MGMDSPTHHPLRPAAIIFDMDGVLVDSNPFHLRKWMALFQAHGVPYIEEELPKTIMGPANDWIFRHFLGEHLTREQLAELGDELEVNFRRAIGPSCPVVSRGPTFYRGMPHSGDSDGRSFRRHRQERELSHRRA